MTFWQWFGLIGLVVWYLTTGVVLSSDLIRRLTGRLTYSEVCWAQQAAWAAAGYPLAAVPVYPSLLVLGVALGAAFLAVHLYSWKP